MGAVHVHTIYIWRCMYDYAAPCSTTTNQKTKGGKIVTTTQSLAHTHATHAHIPLHLVPPCCYSFCNTFAPRTQTQAFITRMQQAKACRVYTFPRTCTSTSRESPFISFSAHPFITTMHKPNAITNFLFTSP